MATLESKFRIYNMRTQHPDKGFAYLSEKVGHCCLRVSQTHTLTTTAHYHDEQAHKSTVWLGRHLPQNRDVFMTAGGNGGLNMYR